MDCDELHLEAEGGVWRATLNRPQQGNALSVRLVHALDDALAHAEAAHARAFVLRGEGRHFCTGFDLSQLERETDDSLLARFVRIELMLQRLAGAPFLTVALAQGRVMGAGADLFAACTVRAALPGTSFAFPGARGFGLVLGTRRLSERVGGDAALEWVESARSIPLEEASLCGLVTHAVDDWKALDPVFATQALDDPWVRGALRESVAGGCHADPRLDLDLLVRSAARPGLRERIEAYVARTKASRPRP